MNKLQELIEIIKEFGFEGDDSTFSKGNCYISISDEKIKLWFNVPGIDKDYIGPPLPSKNELKKFLKETTF